MSEPTIVVVDEDHCVAYWKNVFIQVWRQNPVEQKTRRMRAEGQRFLDATKGPVGALVVVEPTCKTPEESARVHSIAFIRDLGTRGKGIGLVFEGEGFLAAASRAVMVGLMSAANFAIPYQIVRSVAQGQLFLESSLPHGWVRGELAVAVEAVRSSIPSPAAARR